MTDTDTAPPAGPYAAAAPLYWSAGFKGVLPLPAGTKTPVPRGFTGRDGAWPSFPDVQAWTEDRGNGNIALRLPPDVLGVDCDHYDSKPGGAILADLERRLGPLPATWRSTSRDDGVSGIRLYRIPAGLRWPGILGPGIETIRHEHRYALAWPSVHPNGGTYRWITPDGATALGVVPQLDDLPDLPAAWVEHFTHGEVATDQPRANLDGATSSEWLATRGAGHTCRRVDTAVERGLLDLTTGASRHDAALTLTNRIVWLAGEGHTGVTAALSTVRDAFLRAVGPDRADGDAQAEWDRMVLGAIDLAAAAHPAPSPDPCLDPFAGLIAPSNLQELSWTSPTTSSTASQATPTMTNAPTVTTAPTTPTAANRETPTSTATEDTAERTSWWPRDLEPAITGDNPEPPPAFLARDDEACLFYAAKVNGLIGPSESGKTWVALVAVAQAVHAKQNVTILDFEDSDTGLVTRLQLLGLEPDQIRTHVAYLGPDQMLGAPEHADLLEHLALHRPELIVLDGFNAAMTLLGLDLNSNTDATRFAQVVLKPLARTGAAVVYIDHTPKDVENKSSGGIGAQAKRAMTTGCALKVEVVKQFGKGQEGKLRLRVDKDRPGYVRGVSLPGKTGHWAADVTITPGGEDALHITVTAPTTARDAAAGDAPPFRPTGLMERVSSFLEAADEPVSSNAVTQGVRGKRDYVLQALEILVTEGYVSRTEVTGRGGARFVHASLKHFTEAIDELIGSGSRSGSQVVPGTSSSGSRESGSPPPLPYRGREPLTANHESSKTALETRSGSRVVERVIGGDRYMVDLDSGEMTPLAVGGA